MKKFYANFKSVVAAVVMASMTLAASCSYDDSAIKEEMNEIKQDLTALTERVAALEKRLGEEVEALTALINGKVVVTGVEQVGDATKVTLSDGTSFTVYPECTVVDTDTDTNTYISIAEDNGVLYFAVYEKGEFKEWLTINGEKVPVYDGNDDDDVCDNPYQPEAPVAPKFQVNTDTGEIEVSVDGGQTWVSSGLSAAATGTQLFSGVTVNENNTVTFTLADGSQFDVLLAELIEFNSTRAQAYIKAGETKEISFTVNDAVADINIMNQPLGWKATVEAAVADEEAGEGDENVDPGMGILAAGGTEFVLKVTAPSSEFVATGFAEKEGFVSVHFNTAAGACKVAKLQVNLAEITLDVDKAGNVTITNTLVDTYLYSDWWGNSELISEFNNYYLAVMPLDYYTEDLESIYNASWGEFNVPCAGGWINNIYMNLNDRNQYTYYEEGVTESWTVVATVEEIIDYLDWYHYLTYEGESFMVLVIPTDIENNGTLLLDQAIVAPFKQLNVNVVENEAERKFNNAYFNVTLRGGLAYNLFPVAVAEIEEYIAMEYYASVEEYFEMAMQQYVAQPNWSSFGFKVSTDVVEPNIALMDLLGYTLDYEPYFAIEPNTEYVMAIFTEQEGKTEYTGEDLKYVYFATADIVEAATPAEYTIEYNDQRTYTNIGVDVTVPENTAVAYTRWYEEEQLELDALKADLIENGYDRTDFEYSYTFSTSTAADKAAAVRYLGLLIVNADGEYTLVQEKLTSKDVVYNTATLAIDKVEFPGDGTAKVYFSGIDGLEIDHIKFYSSNVANTSTYYRNLTEEELADISYSDNWLYRTASDNSNPVVIPYDVAYNTFVVGNTYKFAIGVVFTDGTVSNCAYLEAENALPAGAFTPVRAELDLYFDLYEYNGGDAEYAFWLYDDEDACLEVIYKYGPHTDWDDDFTVNFTKADGTVVEGYTSLQTQQPNDYNCADGEKYYVVIVTLSDGTEINIQAQLPTTEVNYLGEGATTPGEGEGDEVIVLNSAKVTNNDYGYGDFYVTFYGDEHEFVLNFYNCAATNDNFLNAGTYPVDTAGASVYPGADYSKVICNAGTYGLFSGTVTVAEVDGQYKFDLNVETTNGLTFVATYTGAVEGLVVPSAFSKGFTPVRAELDLYSALYDYNGGDAEYAFNLYDAENACLQVIYKLGPHTDWDDVFVVNMTKADGTVVEGYTSLQTQQPNDYNCEDGEKYYVVDVILSDGTAIFVQDQLPTTENNDIF